MWEIVPWIVPRPWKSYAVRKNLQKLFGGCCCGRRGGRRQGSAAGVALPPPLIVLPMSASSLHSSAPKGALHPRHVSRGVRFELLVNEANPVLGLPRTTKVSETPLKLKNAPLLKCCQPACLNHLSALNAQELFATDLMPSLLKP